MIPLMALALVSISSPPAKAQMLDFRNPQNAPPSWVQFAKLVKFRFEEWITADDPVATRFRAYLKIHAGTSDGPPSTLTVRAWINPDGTVERVVFPVLEDKGASDDLRRILTRGNVGERPPSEMLQPVNLRFSLNINR